MLNLVEMSVTGGILIAAVVILRAVAGHRLPRQTFLALWGVALVRLLLPFSLPAPTSVYRGLDALEITVRRAGVASNVQASPVTGAAAETAAGTSAGTPVLLLAWGGVALAVAAFFVLAHLRGRREYRTSLPAGEPFIQAWLAEHPMRRPLQVRYSDRIDTPLTYGMFRPVILLPKSLDRNGGERLSFVLAHELVHVRRWDALSKCFLCAAVCVHWFNPLVWVMLLLAGRDLEVSCDQKVVQMYGRTARGPYARTLLELESRRTRLLPLTSGFSKNALEERIGAIMKSKNIGVLGLVAAVVVVTVVTAVFATTAPRDDHEPADGSPGVAGIDQALNAGIVYKDGVVFQSAEYGLSGEPKRDPETGRYYTKAQYELIANLKTEGYEDLSIAEFNRTIYAALNDGTDEQETMALLHAYEMVLTDLPQEDPLAPFLLNTVQASLAEYQDRLSEVYSGKQRDSSFTGHAERNETADVFGDTVSVGWAQVDYSFSYRILDQDNLTVQERDAFLQAILDGMQAWLDGQEAKSLTDQKAVEKALSEELDRLGKAASTAEIAYTKGNIGDYYGELYYEGGSYGIREDGTGAVTQGAWS